MWPILLCSVAAITVIIERIVYFLSHLDLTARITSAIDTLSRQKTDEAGELLRNCRGPVSRFLVHLISSRSLPDTKRDATISARGDEILGTMERGLFILTLTERIAPLFGFLGTVIGMIRTFIDVSQAAGPVQPNQLAGGIWEALLTTAAGLAVAIPALGAHHLFETYISRTAARMKQFGEKVESMLLGPVDD